MDDRELLIRYRDGDLPAESMVGVEERLRSDPELRARWESLQGVATLLEQGAVRSFEPFFAARVVATLRESDSLAPVVMLGIGTYSALGGGYGGSVVDSMLGLPEPTLETALILGG